MNNSFSFLTLKDEFYEEYKIPQLPFPLKTEAIADSLKEGGLPIPVIVDNLLDYLEEEPGELGNYQHTLTTLSYYAGTWEGQKRNYEAAYKYLKVAQEYGNVKNVSIIYSLGLTCMMLKKIKEAREVFFRGYAFTRHQQFIPEIWMNLIVCDCMLGDVDAGIKLIHEFFEVGNRRYPTSHPALFQDLNSLVFVSCKDARVREVLEKYNTPDYPGFLGGQG